KGDHGSAHDRSEDLLTSTVFGLFEYFSLDDVIKPLIQNVRDARQLLSQTIGERAAIQRPWINLEDAASCKILFWPSFSQLGQPDILLAFRNAKEQLVHLVVVEAKLFSGKSGEAGDEQEIADESAPDLIAWHPDQLVKYWRGLLAHRDFAHCGHASLVYLTA